MGTSTSFRWMGLLFYSAIAAGFGQVATTSQSTQPTSPAAPVSQNQATLQAFRTEQLALARQEEELEAQGATPKQLAAWRQQNASQLAAQQQLLDTMAVASALQMERENRQPRIPPDASPTLKAYLTTRAALANAHAKIHNQLVQEAAASGGSLTPAQVDKMEQKENQLFHQQNSALLALQEERSQAMANASAQTVRPVPRSSVIPPNASPQLAAYLTSRNQLEQEMIQVENQYANATPAAREAALQNWHRQNAGQFAQLQQQAQALSQANTTTLN